MQITLPAALSGVSAKVRGSHALDFGFGAQRIAARLRVEPGRQALLVLFHGAVDTESRRPPYFMSVDSSVAAAAHCLALSDPSLRPEIGTPVGWFAGDHACATPVAVPQIIAAVAAQLGVSRRVYFGSSSGGFAALAYAQGDPGSVAIAVNPQTRISQYHSAAVAAYRARAWPDLAPDQPLSARITDDLTALYAADMPNLVALVLSMGDRFHLTRHALPLISAIHAGGFGERLMLHSDYWGHWGHAASGAEAKLWMRAACLAEAPGLRAILTLRDSLRGSLHTPSPAPEGPAKDGTRKAFSEADLRLGRALARHRAAAREKVAP